jgi:hypothetical protein
VRVIIVDDAFDVECRRRMPGGDALEVDAGRHVSELVDWRHSVLLSHFEQKLQTTLKAMGV